MSTTYRIADLVTIHGLTLKPIAHKEKPACFSIQVFSVTIKTAGMTPAHFSSVSLSDDFCCGTGLRKISDISLNTFSP